MTQVDASEFWKTALELNSSFGAFVRLHNIVVVRFDIHFQYIQTASDTRIFFWLSHRAFFALFDTPWNAIGHEKRT